MFDRTFTVKRSEIDDPLYKIYYVDPSAVFMRGKKVISSLENKAPAVKETREAKAEAIKQSNPFVKFDKSGQPKPNNNSDRKQKVEQPSYQEQPFYPKRRQEYTEKPEKKEKYPKLDKLQPQKKRSRDYDRGNQNERQMEKVLKLADEYKQMADLGFGKNDKRQRHSKQSDRHLEKNFKKFKEEMAELEDADSQSEDEPTSLYEPYIDEKIILESRKNSENKYYVGTVSVNQRTRWFAWLDTDELPGKLVAEREHMNRALHDSTVYFQLIEQSDSSGENSSEEEPAVEKAPEAKAEKIKCKIVCIKENPYTNKKIVGRLTVKKRHNKDHFQFAPYNPRLPNFEVGKNPFEGKQHRPILDKKYFSAKVRPWGEHDRFPRVDVIDIFGQVGEVEVECKALLQQNNIYEADFTEQTQKSLSRFTDNLTKEGQYIIPKEQYEKRYDLRKDVIFTIDPKTARDFDDALSIKELSKEEQQKLGLQKTDQKVYEVGIHIADVSYFVPEGSLLDDQAKRRTTSVYLVHRVIPMLPRILCETMCSLNPGVERLTVSVWCYINEEGIISEKQRYGRSIIQSHARFSYEIVQDIIDGKIKPGEVPAGYGVTKDADEKKVFECIGNLNTLARILRKKRIDNGAITIDTPKKKFELDARLWPESYSIDHRFEANFLVEQFMLLANVKVAEILVDNCREAAVLRRHPFPSEPKLKRFSEFMKRLGLDMHVTRTTKISEEMNKIINDETIKSSLRQLAKYETMFLMEAADYFLVKDTEVDKWFHYALNFRCYTHFTSPIRRYPDILVHRELIKVMELKQQASKQLSIPNLEKVLTRCNEKRLASRKVSSGCEKIFMCLYLRNHEVFTKGVVTSLGAQSISITIPEYDIRTNIDLRNIKNLKNKELEEVRGKRFLRITYESKKLSYEFVVRETNELSLWLGSTRTFPIDYSVRLAFPDHRDTSKMACLD